MNTWYKIVIAISYVHYFPDKVSSNVAKISEYLELRQSYSMISYISFL